MSGGGIPRQGLTLIELTIAIGLSAVVLLAAVSAFRTAQQTMSICMRLGQENDAFRLGLQAGLEEVDYWRATDAPGGPGGSLIRRYHDSYPQGNATEWAGQDNRGPRGPFTPWDFADPYQGPPAGITPPDSSYGSVPAFSGDASVPDFAQWTVDRPETWYRGSFVQMGNDGSWSIGAYEQLQRLGQAEPERRWLPNAVHAVARHGGVYAAIELLPPGTVYGWYRHDGKEQGLVLPFSPHNENDIGNKDMARYNHHAPWPELSRLQSQDIYMLVAGVATGEGGARATSGDFRRRGNDNDFDEARTQLRTEQLLTAVKPPDYPDVTASVRRMWVFMRPYTYTEVAIMDEESGHQSRLGFHVMGTTLRGARHQRAWNHGPWAGEDLDASW